MEYTKGATSVDYGYDSEGQRVSKTVNGVEYDYYYVGGKLMVEHCPSYTLFYSYDANGNLYAIKKQFSNSSYEYYYAVCNSRGDVLALYNEGGNLECKYYYDSWGKLISVADHNGNSITAQNHIAIQNSIRYRGYVYDTETGLYYLNSRYYDPATCRFINADNQIALGYDLSGVNLYAYCGSNPISRIDPTGEKWWHWAIGAAIVGACAVATVVTAGGFVAAAGAVAAVGRIVGALPREDGAFQVRHHGQVTTIGRANARHVVVRPVGVGGIAAVFVFGHNVIGTFLLRQAELAFAVRHPNAELAARERAEHDGMVVGYGERDKLRLELVRIVV